MKEGNIILDKSYAFAIRIVKLYLFLRKERKEYNLSEQIVKSGTSIGANIEEAIGGSSRKDFKAKLAISYREARETRYWIRLLSDTNFIEKKMSVSLLNDCEDIIRILSSILNTLEKS